jgi:hypothetical protein
MARPALFARRTNERQENEVNWSSKVRRSDEITRTGYEQVSTV